MLLNDNVINQHKRIVAVLYDITHILSNYMGLQNLKEIIFYRYRSRMTYANIYYVTTSRWNKNNFIAVHYFCFFGTLQCCVSMNVGNRLKTKNNII